MAEQKTINRVSGVNVDVLKETITAVQNEAELGKASFHVHNKWLGGGHNRGTVTDFYSAGEKVEHKECYSLDADEPEVVGCEDKGANPVEHLLNALAACLTNSLVCHAAARGIEIEELECEVQGEIDLNGFLGLSDDVRNGYQNISVSFKVKTDDASTEELLNFAKFSPVFDTVTNGTPVDVQIEKK